MSSPNFFSDPVQPPKPWATIVMPIRKCRATVGRSLDALLCQKILARCEIIVVCDQFDDDSLTVVRQHPLRDHWDFIEIFHPGRGLAQAYNLGWKAARSQYVFIMHSDCYPADDDAMLRLVDCLESKGAGAVMPLNDIPQGDWESMSLWDRVTSAQFRHAKPAHALMGKFDLFRREALEKVGGFDEERFFSSAEDADMVEKICSVGKMAYSDVIVIHAHQHPSKSAFKSALRKHTQLGEGTGALFRKHWHSWVFFTRAWPVIGVNVLKLLLLIGIFIPPVSIYAAGLMLLLSIYYARWAMLTCDWRVVLIPFAVSLMFSFFAVAMVRAFIRGRQSFDYIKAK